MIINDGTGSGYAAKVSDGNMLMTRGANESFVSYASQEHGRAFMWSASKDIDATDNIMWIRNDDKDRMLRIVSVIVSSAGNGVWFIYRPTGTTPDGDAITGVNLNADSGVVALATCRCDATGVTPANYIHYGANIAYQQITIEFHGALMLGYLDELAVDFTTEVTLAQCTILGYYHTEIM